MQTGLKTQRPPRPLLAIGLLIGGLYSALSLLSYSRTDPSWSFSSTKIDSTANWGGIVGSYLSDSLLQLLGLVAYVLTFGAIFGGVRLLQARTLILFDVAKANQRAKWKTPTSLLMISLSLAALLSITGLQIYQGLSLGGILGYWISQAGVFCFSSVGATLIFAGLFWAGMTMLTDKVLPPLPKLPQLSFTSRLSLRTAMERLMSWARAAVPKSPFERKPSVHLQKSSPTISQDTQKKLNELFAKKAPAEKESPKAEEETPQLSLSLFSRKEPEVQSDRVLLAKELPQRKKSTPRDPSLYEVPSLQLLELPQETGFEISKDELIANSRALEQKLLDFGIQGQVTNIRPGPIITLYEFEPAPGVKVKNITNLTDDLKLAMKSVSIRILAPIPGKAAVGIEIPNPRRQTVYLREILQSPLFQNASSPLAMGMGKTTSGEPYVTDLSKMPHLLIAGATGSGKSVGLNGMIVSMLFKASPDELKFIMIDPKMLELSVYDGIPHLLLPVVTDPKKAARALAWAVKEMERRYKLISSLGARNLRSYNDKVAKLSEEELKVELEKAAQTEATTSAIIADIDEAGKAEAQKSALEEAGLDKYVKLPNIVIVIDELADLIMVAARDVEESIARLAQMARAAGIHLMIATQRPSVDVITGVIKANLPTRCAFQVASKVDSRTIIDGSGAENLIGEGDMLFLPPGTSRLERLHGPFISEDEIARLVRHLKLQGAPDYSTEINLEDQETRPSEGGEDGDDDIDDALYDQALNVVFETKSPSASMLQRRLRIGYNRAARLVERMEREGIVSAPQAGGKGRELLITPSHDG